MRHLFVFALILGLSLPLLAQQTGDVNRDYLINGGGSGGTSPVATTLLTPGAFDQLYNTLDAGAPVIWATANAISVGAFNTPTNSLDLDLLSLSFLGVGGGPGLINSFFFTDSNGVFSLAGNVGTLPVGLAIPLQMAHLAATSPDGFWLSQAHVATVASDGNLVPGLGAPCNPLGAVVPGVGDDTATQMPLGFTYMHYGVAYTDIFIGSNGFITFGAGDTDFTETVTELLNNAPRIAMYWDDLTPPSSGGTVNFFTDNLGNAEVCFTGVPEFFNTGANTFNCLFTANLVLMDFGAMTSTDGIVGLSPGNGLDPVGTPLNLSVSNNVIGPNAAAYEQFDGITNVNDLSGFQVSWVTDAAGAPIAQL